MKQYAAFTLIEVLIALTIIAIAYAAILTATSSDVQDMIVLKQKTAASLLADDLIAQTQLGLESLPFPPYHHSGKETVLKQPLIWEGYLTRDDPLHTLTLHIQVKSGETTVLERTGYMSQR